MNTKTRTHILVHAEEKFLESLLSMIDVDFKIIEEPHYALVMMKMRDTAQQHLFYSGEVLVTQAKVMLNDIFGLGILMGMNDSKALNLAKIDAVFKNNHVIMHQWILALTNEKQRQDDIAKKEIDQLLNTKVEFETMDKPYEI